MAYSPPVRVGLGGSMPRSGPSFARARLVLAQRSGYLPPGQRIQSGRGAMDQWGIASKDLAAKARGHGFTNPMQWLRQGATQGQLPERPQAVTPTGGAVPTLTGPTRLPAVSNLQLGSLMPKLAQQAGRSNADPRVLALLQALMASGRTR